MSNDRDDAALLQFKSRSQQPKLSNTGPTQPQSQTSMSPVTINLVFDSGFGNALDDIDDTRFKYIGTSPHVSMYEGLNNRRTGFESMRSGFQY